MVMGLKDKIAVITGAASGIGKQIAAYVSPAAILVCSETHFTLLHFGNFVRQCEFCFGRGEYLMRTVSLKDAIAMIPEGATLMIGGFMGVGTPERIIDELVRQRKHNLSIIANDTAVGLSAREVPYYGKRASDSAENGEVHFISLANRATLGLRF
jgi:hypothetical protein